MKKIFLIVLCVLFVLTGIFYAFASVTAVIGPEGGELYSQDDGVKLIFPQGALNVLTQVEIKSAPQSLDQAVPQGSTMLSVIECLPHGLTFNVPVSLTYYLKQSEIPGTPVELGLYDSQLNEIVSTGQTSTVSASGYEVTFQLDHFSTYAALKNLVSQGAAIGSYVKIPLPDMLTGSFSHAIPISIVPGRCKVQPQVALTYRSGSVNGWLGVGFNLNPGYITRSTRLGPASYDDTQDTFYFVTDEGTTELVRLADNLYQAKIESSFMRFYKEAGDYWRLLTKEGALIYLGESGESREESADGTFSWYVTKARDTNGNYIEYHYIKDQGKSYLSRIDYTGNENGVEPMNSVEFFLEARNDVFSSYMSGSKIVTAKRLREIQVKNNGSLVWRYVLEYSDSSDTSRSLLAVVKVYAGDGTALPEQRITYQDN